MQGYCVRCKAKKEMLSPTRTIMKNGRRAMLGFCACCGSKMSVAGKWDEEPAAQMNTEKSAAPHQVDLV